MIGGMVEMKKYTAPNMSIRVFNNTAQTSAQASIIEVDAIKDLPAGQKAQVQYTQMNEITKFTF